MSLVRVEEKHALGITGAREAVRAFEEQVGKYGMKLDWNGNRAVVKGVGASGSVDVRDDRVVIEIKLGMLARAAGVDAGRLEGSITRRLKAALGTGTGG